MSKNKKGEIRMSKESSRSSGFYVPVLHGYLVQYKKNIVK